MDTSLGSDRSDPIGMEENVIIGIYCVGNSKLLTDVVT